MGKHSIKYIIENNLAVIYNTEQLKINIPISNNFILDKSVTKPLK